MPLTRLDNLYSSKTGKYLYVSPDDFNATDALDNRGNSPLRPFVSIQRAFLEVARYSYVPNIDNDRFDQFTIMLSPGNHYIDNRPGDLDTSNIPIFNYDDSSDEWNDDSIFDLSNPNNCLYRFNGRDGGATIPRGTSLVGTDLRRTQVRALYVPDPADKDVPRTALFNVTGGCYFWQFTILDANDVNGPLNGKAYNQPGSTQTVTPLFSHHKMTNFVFADKEDLGLLYRKISQAFSKYQPDIDDVYTVESGRVENTWYSTNSYAINDEVVFGGEAYKALAVNTNKRPDLEDTFWERLSTTSREFDYRIQENRIVGPLSDTVQIDIFNIDEPTPGSINVTVRTKINHGFFPGQYVAVANLGFNKALEGVFQVIAINTTNPKEFTYRVNVTANAVGLSEGIDYTADPNATVQAEVDSVESASPYVFNVSIRSTWGICGIWADGRKATGFKSMVIAQYTGVSLQKDDRAFIRYDEFSNTWNEAPLTDAFATTPYHIKGDAYWKDDWRNFHVRASDDSFIQNVSIFAVGFADHFLLESGGDMSITNSNSNFGNTSMHSKGYKGFAFNQDKGGYITDIIPPETINDSSPIKVNYYALDVQLSKPSSNSNRLYLVGDKANNFLSRPAASINGYRIGARSYITDEKSEKLYVNISADTSAGESGATTKSAFISPSGFKKWSASLDTLSPANLGIGDLNQDGFSDTAEDIYFFNLRQDAANLIDANKTFIQAETFGYILEKYPYLQNIPYVNPNITAETGRYRDGSNLIKANRQEIIDYAFSMLEISFPSFVNPDEEKCKRDLGFIIDAIANDLYDGGNAAIIEATKAYFDANGQLTSNGLLGEQTESIYAFNRMRDWAKKAVSNLLENTSLLEVDTIISSGTTVTVTTLSDHNLEAGQTITVGGATQVAFNGEYQVNSSGLTATQFTYTVPVAPSISNASGAYYISTIVIDVTNDDGEAGRYKDASNLVTANRQEIIDRAFGEIAIQYNEAAWGTDWVVPGDTPLGPLRRYFDSYRLIQKNRNIIVETAYKTVNDNPPSPAPANLLAKCKRDIGLFVDAISLDILEGGANVYTRKFVQQYFSANTTLLTNGLAGEVTQSITAFNKARDAMKAAITNTLSSLTGLVTSSPVGGTWVDGSTGNKTVYTDLTLTADPLTGSNTDPNSCASIKDAIDTLTAIASTTLTAVDLSTLPPETTGLTEEAGQTKCKRDIGYIVDSIAQDLFWGGNEFTVGAIVEYFANNTTLTTNGLSGEVSQSIIAFNAAKDMAKKAVTNQLYAKNLSLSYGDAEYGGGGGIISYTQSGNAATCVDVQLTIDTLFGIVTNTLTTQNLSSLPPVDNGEWDCANVRNTIDTLFSILTTSLATGNLLSLPEEDIGPWAIVSDSSKCRRDIGYIVEALTSDLRLGGNEATVRAAEAYYTGNSLDYIENERIETLDAYDYARNLAISSMRNHGTYMNNCLVSQDSSIITVPSTNGLVIGMQVQSVAVLPDDTGSITEVITNYNDELEEINSYGRVVPKANNLTQRIPSSGAYIKKIGDGTNGLLVNQIQLGSKGSKFNTGGFVFAASGIGNNVPTNLFFSLNEGIWATSVDPSVDNTVLQDFNYTTDPFECSAVVESINTYFGIFNQIIENGLGTVDVEYSQINTGTFAQRSTLFTLTDTSNGASPSDPHHLETGTPVRLVPRAKEGSNIDKRLIRLPKGFDTNTVYYVIAPGRKTDPYDYSNTTRFNGSAGSLQNLMLATSVENAASGIFVYSSETEGVNSDVVIDLYQYVLDVDYDLNTYITRKVTGDGVLLETEEPHVFDIPTTAYNTTNYQQYQAVFFKPIGSGSLPVLTSGGNLSENREYFVRYVDKRRFKVYETLQQAVNNTTPLQFANFTSTFYTLSNKKRSPLRFAPEAGAQQSYDELKLYVEDKTLFANGDYVKVDEEFFLVTGISPSGGSDYLIVARSALGSIPTNHQTNAVVTKWAYSATGTITLITEAVNTTETILDFADASQFAVGDYVRLTNSVNSNTEVVTIKVIEFTTGSAAQVVIDRAQLGTFAQSQSGTVTATKLTLLPTTTTTTLSETYPRLLSSVSSEDYAGGNWYISTDSSKSNTILQRIRKSDYATKDKTPDTWFERIEDSRDKKDRIYRLRYVIPRYLRGVRDPLRGFVIKARNDSTRRLLPQKILIKPTSSSPLIPELTIANATAALSSRPDKPGYEFLGYTSSDHGPTFESLYDPYNSETNSEIDTTPKYRVKITTDSKVTCYVQSARKKIVKGKEYIELTVFNIGIEEQGYKEKIFTTVKITPPQGGNGSFVANTANLPENNTSNIITWSGACKGKARVHAYFSYENQYYMILKDISIISTLKYDPFETVTFQQGSVSANLADYPDGGRSDIDNYLYVVEGSNVYTMTPGDTFTAPNGNYTIASVEDTKEIENTFYIFDIDEVRRRIFGQQDGIYYLTCLRGNISPFPTGAGVGENFRNFKFSQPVSKLYPEFYKNDPEWYKQLDPEAIDPPATISAADNYIHGLVAVNDSKASVTKECVVDFISDQGLRNNAFTGDNEIKAQDGGASAGSESRRISISGDSPYPTEGKFYVELRRPSIARSGNHTFEYLGFGPGNYSTGFPARQEVVLTDVQDFYAQAKREDGGIVFYTGLNSNGDLYIGNRKINAITGEETFLESAELTESEDQADTIGNFVTTFDDPVVFNDIVSFLAPLEKGVTFFSSPLSVDVGTVISSTGLDAPPAITIKTNINTSTDDNTLAVNPVTGLLSGDIKIGENRISTAIVSFNARGSQSYSIRTANYQFTPDQANTFGTTNISFGSKYPLKTGDILLKGTQVGLTGSLGWIYANSYDTVPSERLLSIEGFGLGNNYIRINWNVKDPGFPPRFTNSEIGITSVLYQVRISGIFVTAQNSGLNNKARGVWTIKSDTFSPSNTFIDLVLSDSIDVGIYDILEDNEPSISIAVSNVAWKEYGVVGSEAIRTETGSIGNYKVGINTVARSAHSAYDNSFVSAETTPRANLDVVGNTFISGRSIPNYLGQSTISKSQISLRDAFVVGGNSAALEVPSALRLSTTSLTIQSYNNTNTSTCVITTVEPHGLTSVNNTNFAYVEFTSGLNTTKTGTYRITAVPTANSFTISNQTNYPLSGLTVGNISYATGNVTLTRGNQTNSYTVNNVSVGSVNGRLGVNTSLPVTLDQISRSASVVTIRTKSPHGYYDGEVVNLYIASGSYTQYGSTAITISNATEFTFDYTTSVVGTNFSSISIDGYVSNEGILDREFVVRGDGRLTGNLEVKGNTVINGTNVDTTNTTLNLYNTTATTVNAFGDSLTVNVANNTTTTGIQNINLGNYSATQTLTIGDAASTATLNIHRNAKTSVIDIGTVDSGTLPGGSLHNSQITVGGAWTNTSGFLRVRNRNTIFDSDSIEVGAGPASTLSQFVRIFTQANELRLFDTGGASIVQLCRNAGQLSIASDGGETTINNSLVVKASQETQGGITLSGGLNSGSFTISRASWGTTASSHVEGSITARNIDFYKYTVINKRLDTAGSTYWGDTSFQVPGSTTGEYFLYLNEIATANDFSIGDYLLIDRARHVATLQFVSRSGNVVTVTTSKAHGFTTGLAVTIDASNNTFDATNVVITVTGANTFTFSQTGTNVSQTTVTGTALQSGNEAKSELVKITEITNISNTTDPAGLRLKVLRGQDGTTSRTDHPDECILSKFVKFDNASWITNDGGINSTSTSISTAEFGGSITTNDYLRLDDNEIVKIAAFISSDIQSLKITDGGDPAITRFLVESTTGNVTLAGDFAVGQGAVAQQGQPLTGKLTVDGDTGNTNIAGTLTVENTFTLNGSTTVNSQFFRVTDGAASPAIKFQIDSANGNTIINGGNFNVYASDGTTSKFSLSNSSGDITVSGALSALGSGTSTYGGDILLSGGATGGNLEVRSNGIKRFKVSSAGNIDLGGLTNYFGYTGARRWEYVSSSTFTAQSNVSYFVAASANVLIKLPLNPVTGDMIRFVDIGGNLTYNVSLVIRAVTGTAIQGDSTNTGSNVLGGTFAAALSGYDGGELVIQTPNAGLGLVYAGPTLNDGSASGIPGSGVGWWLMEI